MAIITYVEVDGRKVEFDTAAIKTERRCDACGEYVGDAVARSVGLHLSLDTGQAVSVLAEAHPEHLAQAAADAHRKAWEQLAL